MAGDSESRSFVGCVIARQLRRLSVSSGCAFHEFVSGISLRDLAVPRYLTDTIVDCSFLCSVFVESTWEGEIDQEPPPRQTIRRR